MKITQKQLEAVEKYFSDRREQMIDAVCRLIEIESVTRPCPDPLAPYGEGCKKAVEQMARILSEQGFEPIDHQKRGVSARWGSGSEEIGVFNHLDVVPAGVGWSGDAFTPVVENGFIRGRGAIDNKGSAIVGLFAACCLRDLGFELKHALRLFYGADEEDMMTCVEHFGKTVGFPKFTLIPDSMFPAAYAEKGIYAGTFRTGPIASAIRSIKGGAASNMVAADCEITVAAKHLPMLRLFETDRVKVTLEKNRATVRATGLSAHASMPEQSLNAIALALDVVLCAGILSPEEQKVLSFMRDCLLDVKGKKLGIAIDMGEYGELSIIGGLVSLDKEGRFSFGFNCRYPATDSSERLTARLQQVCDRLGMELDVFEAVDGFALSPDHPVVTAMTDVFNELTGERRKPFLNRAASYCRMMNNTAIPFGIEMDSTAPAFPRGRGGIHQPDESLNIGEMLNAAKIYVAALIELDSML